jgi:hypothetical protein
MKKTRTVQPNLLLSLSLLIGLVLTHWADVLVEQHVLGRDLDTDLSVTVSRSPVVHSCRRRSVVGERATGGG